MAAQGFYYISMIVGYVIFGIGAEGMNIILSINTYALIS